MRYEAMGRNPRRVLNVPQLIGGLNTSTDAALIEDDEVCDICNLIVDHGTLVTREAVRFRQNLTTANVAGEVYDRVIAYKPIEIDGEPCSIAGLSIDKEGPGECEAAINIIRFRDDTRKMYKASLWSRNVAIAPCDVNLHGSPFLMYHRNMVMYPDDVSKEMKVADENKLYAPLVMINGRSIPYKDYDPSTSAANGVMFEGFNRLTDRYRAQFTPSVGGSGEPLAWRGLISSEEDLDNLSNKYRGDVYHVEGSTWLYIWSGTKWEKKTMKGLAYRGTLESSLLLPDEGSINPKDMYYCELENALFYWSIHKEWRVFLQFTHSGEPEVYFLPTKIDLNSVVIDIVHSDGTATVTVDTLNNGKLVGSFKLGKSTYEVVVYKGGSFTIEPALPASDVAGTVTVTAHRDGQTIAGKMENVSDAVWFGGTNNKFGGTRLFLANRDTSCVMWSDAGNPFYFPENNYMMVGDLSQKITALAKQGEMLVVFKEREIFYATHVEHDIDAEAVAQGLNVDVAASQASFPLTQLSPSIGCRCPNTITLCRDRLVWMDSDARVYTLVMSGLYSERNVREIGHKVRTFLLDNTTEGDRKAASAADHKGKYRVMVGGRMVEFDYSDSGFVNLSGYSSSEKASKNIAWTAHRFDFGENTQQAIISDGAELAIVINTDFVRRSQQVYTLDPNGAVDYYEMYATVVRQEKFEKPIAVSLTTKEYEFGDPVAYKRIMAAWASIKASGARLYFVIDGECPPYGKPYNCDDLRAHLLMPCAHRCQTFGLKIEAEGAVQIKGLRMQYSMFGSVK